MNSYIVVIEPGPDVCDRFREGDVLTEENARRWEPSGVLLLPVDAGSLPSRGATGGRGATAYQRHSYGSEGVAFEGMQFARGCPAAICLPAGVCRVEWMARIAFIGDAAVVSLRLSSDESLGGHVSVTETGYGPRPEADLLRGSATIRGAEGGYATVCLAGACSGVRVLWFALTVLPR